MTLAAQTNSPSSERRSGYSLIELLVACGVMVLLGGGLVALLDQAVDLWERAERSARVYDQARAVLDLIGEDLRGCASRVEALDDTDVRFICDRDALGRQRLRFVRAIGAETADPLLREGGRLLTLRARAAVDGRHDREEAEAGLLAAPAGLAEVLWARDPRADETVLWRGMRSPIGGIDSLFRDRNLEGDSGTTAGRILPERSATGGAAAGNDGGGGRDGDGDAAAAAAADDDGENASPERTKGGLLAGASERRGRTVVASAPVTVLPESEPPPDLGAAAPLARVARPLTDGILFLGFAFWGPTTNTWNPLARPLAEPGRNLASGPLFAWDSTRGLLDLEVALDEFGFRRIDGSLNDSSDDVFPEMVEITLVLRDDDSPLGLRLESELAASSREIVLSREVVLPEDPRDRFVLVGSEWIAVDAGSGRTFRVAPNGRGLRDTKEAPHPAGARVDIGLTFRRVVTIPGARREARHIHDDARDESRRRERRR